MSKYDAPLYDECRRWIQRRAEKGIAWEEIRMACKSDIHALQNFLNNRIEEDDWPNITVDDWVTLVEECEEYANKQQSLVFRGSDGALFDSKQDNALKIPENERSCWQLYKNNLKWKKESIEELENATIGILRRLNADTRESEPIKGLVIGHVQSGKTANMEALMAMAADHGWNMFIVLSGTIESLRLQTLRRMQKDLNQEGNLIWRGIEHPSKNSTYGERAVDFHFEKNSISRYFTVCLKNVSRLRKLIDWIHADKASHDMMRILIIDDEADQASISNTATEHEKEKKERKGINKLIVNLVEDCHYKEEKTAGKAIAMNYVMYTATPYANFLNECTEESLYPRHFIWTLKTSDEYIGPNQIFGSNDGENDGLDIKRTVTLEDIDNIASIYSGKSTELPQSLKDSICWFLCAVAIMRYWNYRNKPISMLVHTSQKQDYHQAVADAISNWINNCDDKELLEMCKTVYARECSRVTKKKWFEQNSKYGISAEQVRDYPEFSKIEEGIKLLIDEELRHIKLNEEGDLQYRKGLHLVIDNCSKNGVQNDNEYVRLAYPDPDMEPYPSPAPAFIIVGGSTLSRGLTIEGLVSTFFLRASCQADSLMQMGRWFGYRRDYELLPRIWMTNDTMKKFSFLSQLEVELREDLKKYMVTEVTPEEYGPRLLATPKVSWLRLTSRNHMKNAISAEMDFSGAKPQTVVFDNDEKTQTNNMRITREFLESLPCEPELSFDEKSLVWKDISLENIVDNFLMKGFSFSERSRVFNEIKAFCDWIKQFLKTDYLNKWSVIVAGKDKASRGEADKNKSWSVCGWNIGKVNRSKRDNGDDASIDIGVLRALADCVADVEGKYIKEIENISKQEHVDKIRKKAGMENVPQLLIYCIDGNSKVQNASSEKTKRLPLNLKFDIIGIHVCVPGEQINKSFCKRLTINLPPKDREDEVEE